MEENKKTYYVSVANGEISQLSTASPWDYKIEATDLEIIQLREYFEQVSSADWESFWRAHVPFLEYHHDNPNNAVDDTNKKIFEMIYRLGDEDAKNHIRSQGIVDQISE
ncbi:hydrolase [Metabacillus fastidiosus]|uniref:Hydrolase n=1 Tax=Metabacillus fastidiosus TaxID=1458 RepID=A0ABU6NVX9_9BACI|nr:hydrolase [Metabacillus fastidiosus]MEC2077809.1 hydrolase [Metabacillus fastidiosus]MED4401285.1 hydrolase [Metabacillus fastidiosus]MED4453137.1 hydrolase [Metabacillus fastidiosus]MED4464212.1 hydrolase [Metabacillus fastidiosus]MED4533525.1 hydrolase [Metabacillus fastidiosus]